MRTLLLLGLLVSSMANAQVTGTILGAVLDESSAAVPGAAVSATNTLTGETRRAMSDATGNFILTALPVGQYKVEVRREGFKVFVATGIALEVNQNIRIDARLTVGAVVESVEVTTDAAKVDTYQTQLGTVVDTNRVNDLPLNGRNVYDLAITLPGVSNTNFNTVSNSGGAFLNVNGSRTRQSTFMLDGAFNNDLWRNSGNTSPNPDAVQEFRLITSNFNAEFGRSPGAVFNVVLKSGTNGLHGSAFEFLRNNRLNARPFFQPTVPQLRQNQYGFSVGGPVIRNKTFFFGSFQGLKIRSIAFVNNAATPTAAERAGDFSAAPANQRPVDPLANNAAFAGARIPVSRFDAVAKTILDRYVPLPNTADNRLQVTGSSKDDENQYLVKMDHMLTSNQKIYGSVFWINGGSYQPFPSSTQVPDYANNTTQYRQRNVVASHDWIVSPAVLNQGQFTWSRRDTPIVDEFAHSWKDYGSRVTLGAEPARPPQLFINGRWQMGTFGGNGQLQQSFSASDTLTATRGKHTLKGGVWFLYGKFDEIGNWLGAGQVRFTGNFTRNTLADFMLGNAASFRQNNGLFRTFRSTAVHGFVQDDWRISSRVTLNLGLRYELNKPMVSTTDELATFRFHQQSTVIPRAPLPHVFVVSYLWDLPRTVRYGWVGKQVVNGWQLSGITRFDSGNPFTVTAGTDTNLDGNANDRADLVGDPFLSGSRARDEWLNQYFNKAAFARPAEGTPGTAGRSILYGPGAATWNLSAFKSFEVWEGHRLQFRSEFFGAFNHPNFGNPNTALNSPNFGRILGAGGARVVQFALKYLF